MKRVWQSTRQTKGIQRFMVASFLWESTLAGLRPFIMLYFIYTLGATAQTGALLLGLVGVTYMVAGLASGFLADKYGRLRIMRIGLWVYLGGCLLGVFLTDIKWAFIFLPIFGLGGSIVLTLPYAILIRLMPKEHIGQFTGMFSMTRGFANIIAPIIAGAAIDISQHVRERRAAICRYLASLGADDRDLALLLPRQRRRGDAQRLERPVPGQPRVVDRTAAESSAGERRADVKRQTGAERHRAKPAERRAGDGVRANASSLVQLTGEQKMVFDCLQEAGAGLTQRQIALRVSCPAPAVEQALAGLVTLNLVARLNTLLPSYACKYPGVRVYTE